MHKKCESSAREAEVHSHVYVCVCVRMYMSIQMLLLLRLCGGSGAAAIGPPTLRLESFICRFSCGDVQLLLLL